MNDFLNSLKNYGVDVETALYRCVGDEELYAECVKLFVVDHHFAGLDAELKKRNYRAAFEHAHALKGVAANLSLIPMLNSLCSIVEPLRAENRVTDYQRLNSNIETERQKLVAITDKLK